MIVQKYHGDSEMHFDCAQCDNLNVNISVGEMAG